MRSSDLLDPPNGSSTGRTGYVHQAIYMRRRCAQFGDHKERPFNYISRTRIEGVKMDQLIKDCPSSNRRTGKLF